MADCSEVDPEMDPSFPCSCYVLQLYRLYSVYLGLFASLTPSETYGDRNLLA